MKFDAKQIANMLSGEVEGNPDVQVWKLCKIEEGTEGGITFLANAKYTHYLYTTKASVAIVAKSFQPEQPISATLIRVDNPYAAFATLLKAYNDMQLNKSGVSTLAFIHPSASIGKNCYIGEFAYVGENVKIGDNVKLYPQVYVGDNSVVGDNTTLFAGAKLYHATFVGKGCVLHAGAVIGADGFGFVPKEDGSYDKIDQIGNVVIGNNVEIGANTCVDRATLGSTIIHDGVKIDNLCQIAHNVVVGDNSAMAAQSAVAGSGKVGKHCIIAGQVGIVGHIEVGDNVTIAAQSGVTRSIPSNMTILGSPAADAKQQRKNYVYMRNLEKVFARLDELEKQLKDLKN